MSVVLTPLLQVSRRFSASAERVFDAWLDPQKASQWLFTTPTSQMVRADIDARVGGIFNFTDRRGEEEIEHVGTYLEIDRPRRLVFTFGVPKYSDQFTTVTVDIRPLASGCELTLTHEGVPVEWASRTQEGWGRILEGLHTNLENVPQFGVVTAPGTVRFERLLPGPVERIWSYLTESEKRERWLASGTMDLRIGGKVEHVFRNSDLTENDDPAPAKYAKEAVEARMQGRITAIEPLKLLAYRWGDSENASEVRFELTSRGEEVMLVVTHSKLVKRDEMLSVAGGWHTHLDILADRLAERTPSGFWRTHTALESEYGKRIAAS